MQRLDLLNEVDHIVNSYCKGCFLKKHFRKTFGKNYAHKFCIKNCTVGQNLQKIGEMLEKQ